MPTPPVSSTPKVSVRLHVPLVVLAVAISFVATGCGAVAHMTATEGNASDGRDLFKQHCGSCHTLKNAETQGVIGPNLDDVFGIVRTKANGGFHESTIRDVVRGQIAYPETETATGGPGMPANLVVGQQADDVAQYVAQCAGVLDCGVGP